MLQWYVLMYFPVGAELIFIYLFIFSICTDVKQALIQWQERIDFAHKLLTLLNSYSPPELRNACLGNSLSRLHSL